MRPEGSAMTTTKAEIAEYRKHMARTPDSARYFLNIEAEEYEREVVQALTISIPRLYALNFEDQEDVPHEVQALIERLETDLALVIEDE
jgi:hypothetical protein